MSLFREEKDVRKAEIEKLSLDLNRLQSELETDKKNALDEQERLTNVLQETQKQVEAKDTDISQLAADLKSVKEELAEKTRINGKVRRVS